MKIWDSLWQRMFNTISSISFDKSPRHSFSWWCKRSVYLLEVELICVDASCQIWHAFWYLFQSSISQRFVTNNKAILRTSATSDRGCLVPILQILFPAHLPIHLVHTLGVIKHYSSPRWIYDPRKRDLKNVEFGSHCSSNCIIDFLNLITGQQIKKVTLDRLNVIWVWDPFT